MTARDNWAQVAHNIRVLAAHYELVADSIDAAVDSSAPVRADAPGAGGSVPPPSAPAPADTQGYIREEDAYPTQPGVGRKPQRRTVDESAFTECPAHHKAWVDGRYGKYCPAQSDEPNWSNDKGYCRVTPRSAAAWLRQHPTVTA